jgi:hypothetical protein
MKQQRLRSSVKAYARILWLPTLGIATVRESVAPATAIRTQAVDSTSFFAFITATLQLGWTLTQDAGPMFLAVAGALLVAIGLMKRKQSNEVAD